MGQSPPGSSYNRHCIGVPLLNGPTEFGPHHPDPVLWTDEPTKRSKVGDLLFCVRGSTTGRMNWSDTSYCIGRGLAAIRGRGNGSDTRFIYYNIVHGLDRLLSRCSGSVFPNLSATDLGSFELIWPDTETRQAITAVLKTIDAKIELNHRMNETLEEIARTLFRSWFVDFDPVRARAEGRKPFGLDEATARLFPRSFEQSELGLIPSGWSMDRIGNAVHVVGGSTPSTSEPSYWEDGTLAWATPKDLSHLTTRVLLRTARSINDAGLARISSGLLPVGTVLLSSRAPIGYLVSAELPVAINQGFIGMVCDQQLPSLYVLWWTEANMPSILARANGTTFQEISKANFRPLPVLIPPPTVLDRFIAIAQPLHQQVVANERQSQTLAELRDSLLPRLLSGELRVKDAERLIESTV